MLVEAWWKPNWWPGEGSPKVETSAQNTQAPGLRLSQAKGAPVRIASDICWRHVSYKLRVLRSYQHRFGDSYLESRIVRNLDPVCARTRITLFQVRMRRESPMSS